MSTITLITGVPGSGKTLYTVWMLANKYKDRNLYVDGIRDLSIEHTLVDEPWLREWYNKAEPTSVICVDEAQRYYPPKSISAATTPDLEAMHTTRHQGVEWILITQHPQRIDKKIRDLVGRHIHVRRLWGRNMAMLYEWDHCHPVGSFKGSIQTTWSYPKDVYKLYTSAEVHNKQTGKIPKALVILPIAAIAACALAYVGYKSIGNWSKPASQVQQAPTGQGQPFKPTMPPMTSASSGAIARPDGLQKLEVAGCAATKNRCTCYTQDGGKIIIPQDTCQGVLDGSSFAYVKADSNTRTQAEKPLQTAEIANQGLIIDNAPQTPTPQPASAPKPVQPHMKRPTPPTAAQLGRFG